MGADRASEAITSIAARMDDDARTRRALLHMLEDLQRERDEIRRAKRQWLKTVDAVSDPMMVHDAEGRVVRANRAYMERAGLSFRDIIGRLYWECFPKRAGPLAGCRSCAAPSGVAVPDEEFTLETGQIFVSHVYTLDPAPDDPGLAMHLFEDVTEVRHAQERSLRTLRRGSLQSLAITAIASSDALLKGDVEQLAREVTESASTVTGVERANVWLFAESESELRCIDLYEAGPRRHSSGAILKEAQFRNEFEAFKRTPYVDAHDPLTDSRTAGYAESYLKPHGITSMLDAVIQVSGWHLGLLCLEHVGKEHRWEQDEITFACRLADQIALAITNRERRLAQEALAHSERYFHKLIEGGTDAFVVVDRSGKVLFCSESGERLTGHEHNEVVGQSLMKLIAPESRDAARTVLARRIADPSVSGRAELQLVQKDGARIDVDVTGRNLLADPDVRGIVLTIHDIRERKQAQQVLEGRERRFRALIENASDLVAMLDREGKIVYMSPSIFRMGGYRSDEVIGRNYLEFTHSEDVPVARAGLAEILADSSRIHSNEVRFRHKDGRWVTLESISRNALGDPAVGAIVINARDVTERRQLEEALRAEERKLRDIVEHSINLFYSHTPDHRLTYVSPQSRQFLDCAPEEALIRWTEFLSDNPVNEAGMRATQRAIETGEAQPAYELEVIGRGGRRIWVQVNEAPVVRDGKTVAIVGALTDITERKTAEDRIRRLNRVYAMLSGINNLIVRTLDRKALFDGACRIAVEDGKFISAGIAEYDPKIETLVAVAQSGLQRGFELGDVNTCADGPHARTTAARAVRERKPVWDDDLAANPTLGPNRQRNIEAGARGVISLPLFLDEQVVGLLVLFSAERNFFDKEEVRLLTELANDISHALDYIAKSGRVEKSKAKLRRSLEATIEAIATALEVRDPYTAGHQRRVAELAAAIASEMGLPTDKVEGVHFGALIHDLGKIQVPAEILAKPTKLTKIEFELIKAHPRAGYDIIKGIDFPWPVAAMVHQHHERLDGSGYPQGLKGDAISIEARILAVADVVEAMASHRPYRPGLGIEAALKEITDKRGRGFEGSVVDACLKLFREKHFTLEKP